MFFPRRAENSTGIKDRPLHISFNSSLQQNSSAFLPVHIADRESLIMEAVLSTIRPHLQPITNHLPPPIRDTAISLLGDVCYKNILLDINPNPECTKLAISKGLGIGIIGASAIVKLPQLIKLLNSRSADGVSFLSYFLETAGYVISLAYNVRKGFPFSTYGENALIAAQNVAIAALILHLTGKTAGAAAFVAGLAAAGYALANEQVVNLGLMEKFMTGSIALSVASKLPQIWTVYQNGGTGQLSAFAVCDIPLTLSRYATNWF